MLQLLFIATAALAAVEFDFAAGDATFSGTTAKVTAKTIAVDNLLPGGVVATEGLLKIAGTTGAITSTYSVPYLETTESTQYTGVGEYGMVVRHDLVVLGSVHVLGDTFSFTRSDEIFNSTRINAGDGVFDGRSFNGTVDNNLSSGGVGMGFGAVIDEFSAGQVGVVRGASFAIGSLGQIGISDSISANPEEWLHHDNSMSGYRFRVFPNAARHSVRFEGPSGGGGKFEIVNQDFFFKPAGVNVTSGLALVSNGDGTWSPQSVAASDEIDAYGVAGTHCYTNIGDASATCTGQDLRTTASPSFVAITVASGGLDVSGTSTFDAVTADGALTVSTGGAAITGDSSLTSGANSISLTTASGFDVTGPATLDAVTTSSTASIGGTLTVTTGGAAIAGDSSLTSGANSISLTTASGFDVTGPATLDSAVITTGATVGTTLDVAGATTLGSAAVTGTLDVGTYRLIIEGALGANCNCAAGKVGFGLYTSKGTGTAHCLACF